MKKKVKKNIKYIYKREKRHEQIKVKRIIKQSLTSSKKDFNHNKRKTILPKINNLR